MPRKLLLALILATAWVFVLPDLPTAQAQNLCVSVARANLRAGPGTDSKKTWEVYENMPFVEVARNGDWLRVRDVDGDEHWVYSRLVSGDRDCVTIKAERANVRKGPGTNHDVWFTVEKYTSFRRVGTQGRWVKVEYEGEVMWIFDSLIWP